MDNQPKTNAPPGVLGRVAGYGALSLVSLLIALYVGQYLLTQLSDISQHGVTDQAFYVLLIILGLSSAAFLFGAMKSTASVSGKHIGFATEVGGPAAFALLVVAGGFLLPRPLQQFDLIIRLIGVRPEELGGVLLYVDTGTRYEGLPVNAMGEATMRGLAASNAPLIARVTLTAKQYQIVSLQPEWTVPSDHILRILIQKVEVPPIPSPKPRPCGGIENAVGPFKLYGDPGTLNFAIQVPDCGNFDIGVVAIDAFGPAANKAPYLHPGVSVQHWLVFENSGSPDGPGPFVRLHIDRGPNFDQAGFVVVGRGSIMSTYAMIPELHTILDQIARVNQKFKSD